MKILTKFFMFLLSLLFPSALFAVMGAIVFALMGENQIAVPLFIYGAIGLAYVMWLARKRSGDEFDRRVGDLRESAWKLWADNPKAATGCILLLASRWFQNGYNLNPDTNRATPFVQRHYDYKVFLFHLGETMAKLMAERGEKECAGYIFYATCSPNPAYYCFGRDMNVCGQDVPISLSENQKLMAFYEKRESPLRTLIGLPQDALADSDGNLFENFSEIRRAAVAAGVMTEDESRMIM